MVRKLFIVVVLLLATSIGGYLYFKPRVIVDPIDNPDQTEKVLTEKEKFLVSVVGCLPLVPGHTSLPWEPLRRVSVDHNESARLTANAVGLLPVVPGHTSLPWGALCHLYIDKSKTETLQNLASDAPLQFLELCLGRYKRDIAGYRATFVKRERVQGKLKELEKLRVHFREKPFSVHMDWLEGAGLAAKTLYVEGENNGKVRARPFVTFLPIMSVEVWGKEAKQTSRYGINKFGMGCAIQACVESMRAAKEAKTLHVTFAGLEKPATVGHRTCYKFIRKPYTPPEEDGVAEITIYIDAETLLQVGSELRDEKGGVIANYYFLDIEINPTFSPDQFTDNAL